MHATLIGYFRTQNIFESNYQPSVSNISTPFPFNQIHQSDERVRWLQPRDPGIKIKGPFGKYVIKNSVYSHCHDKFKVYNDEFNRGDPP